MMRISRPFLIIGIIAVRIDTVYKERPRDGSKLIMTTTVRHHFPLRTIALSPPLRLALRTYR